LKFPKKIIAAALTDLNSYNLIHTIEDKINGHISCQTE